MAPQLCKKLGQVESASGSALASGSFVAPGMLREI